MFIVHIKKSNILLFFMGPTTLKFVGKPLFELVMEFYIYIITLSFLFSKVKSNV
jgi:hypothetical protein